MSLRILLQPRQSLLDWLMENGDASWIGYGGSKGGAKSGAMRRIMVRRRIKYPHTNGTLMRRVWDDVEKNHVNKMWEEFPELHQFYKTGSHAIELPEKLGGGRIFFDSAEVKADVDRKAYGPEFMDIMVDQAEQFTEDELIKIKTTCRWPGMPEKRCKFLLSFNPGGPGAAFLQRIFHTKKYHEREIESDFAFIQARGWDNIEWARAALAADGYPGDCMGKKCGKCCTCAYYGWDDATRFNYYITRTQYGQEQNRLPAHLRAGQLMGDFEKFAGQYFSNWTRSECVCSLGEIIFQPHWPVWASMDWGYQHHTSVHWHTQAGLTDDIGRRRNLIITFRELIKDHMSEGALAEEIVARNDGQKLVKFFAGHDLWKEDSNARSKEQKISAIFRANGLPPLTKANIERVNGWRHMHMLIDEGEWILTENCEEAINALPMVIFDEKKQNEDILKTNTLADDVADDLRYGLYSASDPDALSADESFRRQVNHLKDPTNRAIQLMKLNADYTNKQHNKGRVNSHSVAQFNRYRPRKGFGFGRHVA